MRLENKVCLVTGGGRGIGRAISQLFASEGVRRVYVGDISSESFDEIEDAFPAIRGLVLDVTDPEEIKSAVEEIVQADGSIDVLVNNAGITRDGLIQNMSDEDWNAVVAINLTGVFNMARVIGPIMMKVGKGSIINMASVVGCDGNTGQSNYAATKGGVISMTKTWAKEFARKGAQVRCNAIAPGFIRTPMTEKVPEKILDIMKAKTILGRMGEPEDVARCALFLASDESSFITGTVIRVDGGLVL